jgi:hypothetical protein
MSIRLKPYKEEDLFLIRRAIYTYTLVLVINTYRRIKCLLAWIYKIAIATIKNLRLAVSYNSLPYKTAQNLAEPHLKVLNDKAREIALRHNRKPLLITFTGFRAIDVQDNNQHE